MRAIKSEQMDDGARITQNFLNSEENHFLQCIGIDDTIFFVLKSSCSRMLLEIVVEYGTSSVRCKKMLSYLS